MVKRRERAGLMFKLFSQSRISRKGFFDGDRHVQTQIDRFIHCAHSAFAEPADDTITALQERSRIDNRTPGGAGERGRCETVFHPNRGRDYLNRTKGEGLLGRAEYELGEKPVQIADFRFRLYACDSSENKPQKTVLGLNSTVGVSVNSLYLW